ncbi:MAG: hypothetical protein SWJ54_17345 [Cyanobacteriota bacterium]|nr:hypothetical protein [Cyanobacteriota bacterium]
MSDREMVLELVKQLPSDVSFEEIIHRIKLLQSKSSQSELIQSQKKSHWLPGFFEEVIGGWVGEPLQRSEQGQYESREILF